MLFVLVDAFFKWPLVVMMQSTTVPKTIEALCQIVLMYGFEHLISGNGPQFTSQEFAIFLKSHGIHHTKSATYHQAMNSVAERFV